MEGLELGTWEAPKWRWQLEPWDNYKLKGSNIFWINPPKHHVGTQPATWPKLVSTSFS